MQELLNLKKMEPREILDVRGQGMVTEYKTAFHNTDAVAWLSLVEIRPYEQLLAEFRK